MDRQGYLYAAADTLRRAWTLYIAHIFLFVVYTAQVAYSAAALDRVFYLEETRLDVLAEAPYRALLEALLLRFQPSLLNILPLYVVLLLIFALVLPLLRKPALLLALSTSVYAAVRITGINLPAWTGEGWFFNPLAWQLLFMIGAIMAYAPPRLPRLRWPIDIAAVLVLARGADRHLGDRQSSAHPRLDAGAGDPLRHHRGQDRSAPVPPVFHPVTRLADDAPGADRRGWLRWRIAAPLVLLGQNSLPVFCSGIFLGFLARLGLEAHEGAGMQIAVNLLGALAMVAVGGLAAWYRGKGRVQAQRQPVTLPAVARTDTG